MLSKSEKILSLISKQIHFANRQLQNSSPARQRNSKEMTKARFGLMR